jgi:hypothetical protein
MSPSTAFRCVVDSAVETLAFEDTDFDSGHVQPTAVLGRGVKLDQYTRVRYIPGNIGRELPDGAC